MLFIETKTLLRKSGVETINAKSSFISVSYTLALRIWRKDLLRSLLIRGYYGRQFLPINIGTF